MYVIYRQHTHFLAAAAAPVHHTVVELFAAVGGAADVGGGVRRVRPSIIRVVYPLVKELPPGSSGRWGGGGGSLAAANHAN